MSHYNCKNKSSNAIGDRVVVNNRSNSAGGIQGNRLGRI